MINIKTKLRRAFTIIELVVVIAVIAALAAVLIPTFTNVITSANNSADEQAVYNMNIILAGQNVEEVGDAIDLLVENGYSDTFETYLADNTLKWDNEQNKVVIYNISSDTVTYPDNYVQSSTATLYVLSASSDENNGFAAGDGTSADTAYEIATLSQLESLRTLIDTNSTVGTYYKLARNLDLGSTWEPLGNTSFTQTGSSATVYSDSSDIFYGTFDGNGKTITMNDTTAVDSDSDYALFSYVGTGAVIKNLNVEIDITAADYYTCGAVASYVNGTNADSILFENITVTGTIKALAHGGGIVGWASRGCTFKNCVNSASITTYRTSDYSAIGGISAMAGAYIYDETTADGSVAFINCANYGALTHADSGSSSLSHIGNMTGQLANNNSSNESSVKYCTLTFTDCICEGTIIGSGKTEDNVYRYIGTVYGTDTSTEGSTHSRTTIYMGYISQPLTPTITTTE